MDKRIIVILAGILMVLMAFNGVLFGGYDEEMYDKLHEQFIETREQCLITYETVEDIIVDHNVILYFYKKYTKELDVGDDYIAAVQDLVETLDCYSESVKEGYENLYYAVSKITISEENKSQCDELREQLKKAAWDWRQDYIEMDLEKRRDQGFEYKKGLMEHLKEMGLWDSEDEKKVGS